MVRYFYAWAPLVILGGGLVLALPWLGLIALMIAALAAVAALAALTWAIVEAPLVVGRAIGSRWHGRTAAPRPTPAATQPSLAATQPKPALVLVERRRA